MAPVVSREYRAAPPVLDRTTITQLETSLTLFGRSGPPMAREDEQIVLAHLRDRVEERVVAMRAAGFPEVVAGPLGRVPSQPVGFEAQPGQQNDWLLMPVSMVPAVQQGKQLPIPKANLARLRSMTEAGYFFPDIWIAEELPRGSVRALAQGGELPQRMLQPPVARPVRQVARVVDQAESFGKRATTVWPFLAAAAVAIPLAVAAPLLFAAAPVVATVAMDPIVFGVEPLHPNAPLQVGSPVGLIALTAWLVETEEE